MSTDNILEYLERSKDTDIPPTRREVSKEFRRLLSTDVKDVDIQKLAIINESESNETLIGLLMARWGIQLQNDIERISEKVNF